MPSTINENTTMPNLKLSVTAQVTSGPALTFLDTLTPEGYGSAVITVPGGSTGADKVTVRLAADTLSLLMITSDKYSDAITIESGTAGGLPTMPLTKPVFLSGGALDLLGAHGGELTVENTGAAGTDDAVLTILSAGEVTP
jgi:hypothetical protein